MHQYLASFPGNSYMFYPYQLKTWLYSTWSYFQAGICVFYVCITSTSYPPWQLLWSTHTPYKVKLDIRTYIFCIYIYKYDKAVSCLLYKENYDRWRWTQLEIKAQKNHQFVCSFVCQITRYHTQTIIIIVHFTWLLSGIVCVS